MRLFEGTPFDIPPKCVHCGLLDGDCKCTVSMKARISPGMQTALLSIEKRKKGKIVTVIAGLPALANDHASLLKHLKNSCGAGGAIDGDSIEIQGEHIAKIRNELQKLGYKVRER